MDNTGLFTIGYGQRSLDEFISILHKFKINYLIDVRSQPYSKYKPEFSKHALSKSINNNHLTYLFMGAQLGGKPDHPSCYTNNQVDYEKCRKRPTFLKGIEKLNTLLNQNLKIALMCCEGKPETCHRSRLIGISLVQKSMPILHIDEHAKLITQDEATLRLTKGQLDIFGNS